MKVKEIGIFLLVACIALFSACSDDDDKGGGDKPINLATAAVGAYKGKLSVVLAEGAPAIESTDVIKLSSTKVDLVDIELKDFTIDIAGTPVPAGDILIKDVSLKSHTNGATIVPVTKEVTLHIGGAPMKVDIAVAGTVVDGATPKATTPVATIKVLDLSLSISKITGFVKPVEVTFKGNKLRGNEKTEAKLTKLEFASELVLTQPVIAEGAEIVVHVSEAATAEDLKAMAFTYEASEKATVTPADKLDLSTGEAFITVVSEDGRTTTTYLVKTTTETPEVPEA